MWRTHVLGGISSLWLLVPASGVTGNANVGILAATAAFGALLPDLDATQSKIRSLSIGGIQPFNPVGSAVNGTLDTEGASTPRSRWHSLPAAWQCSACGSDPRRQRRYGSATPATWRSTPARRAASWTGR